MALTDDGSIFWSVKGADYDKTEAFILLAVDDHVAGLQAATHRGRGYRGYGACHGSAEARGGVAPWWAVLGWHGARAAAVHRTWLTWGERDPGKCEVVLHSY